MALLKSYLYSLPCSKSGLTYFPSAQRSGVLVSLQIGKQNFWGEFAPLNGIHTASSDDFLRLLRDVDPIKMKQIFSAPHNSFASWGNHFDNFLYPLSYVLSMMHASRLFHDRELNREIRLSGLITSSDVKEAVLYAQNYIYKNYSCLKIKVTNNIVLEIEKIKAIADIAGKNVALRLDANKKLTTAEAVHLLQGLKGVMLEYFEEPCKDSAQFSTLFREFHVPIAIDESLIKPDDLEALLEAKVQFLIIKLSRFHSVYHAMHMIEKAVAHGITPIFSTCFESDVTVLLAAKIIHALGLFDRPHGLLVEGFLSLNVLETSLPISQGALCLQTKQDSLIEVDTNSLSEIYAQIHF